MPATKKSANDLGQHLHLVTDSQEIALIKDLAYRQTRKISKYTETDPHDAFEPIDWESHWCAALFVNVAFGQYMEIWGCEDSVPRPDSCVKCIVNHWED